MQQKVPISPFQAEEIPKKEINESGWIKESDCR
jgi:hypothetical protein